MGDFNETIAHRVEMDTKHRIVFGDSQDLGALPSNSVQLVVTSPPYPMVEMWDEGFVQLDPVIGEKLAAGDGMQAFDRMHTILDQVWREVKRVLAPGGFACINIGDATRSIAKSFALYPNHARILSALLDLHLTPLPAIIWRKQTNAPNKFMGSGMLPAGAYITLEHEYVLVVRKGHKREFLTPTEKLHRHESALFWEERNQWFSDVWFDLKGTRQKLIDKTARERNGAFPFELPYRLINMYSLKGDTVLDPFLGIGTTMFAAMATARNSVGIEIDSGLAPTIAQGAESAKDNANQRLAERLSRHGEFVRTREKTKGPLRYANTHYQFPVMTQQEKKLLLHELNSVKQVSDTEYSASHRATARPSDSWPTDRVTAEVSGRAQSSATAEVAPKTRAQSKPKNQATDPLARGAVQLDRLRSRD